MKDRDAMAAEIALGTLAAPEPDAALDAEVAAWNRKLAPLCDALPVADPPADLFAKIEQRLFRVDAGLPATRTVRAGEGDWVTLSTGVEAKLLWRNEALDRQSVLIRMAPGAHYESHHHQVDEECVVMEGDLTFGDHQLKAGDYHLALKGGTHPPAFSKGGCLLYINTALAA